MIDNILRRFLGINKQAEELNDEFLFQDYRIKLS